MPHPARRLPDHTMPVVSSNILYLANDMQVHDVAVEDGGEVMCGVMAEYDNVDDVYAAAERVRDAGYTRWDVHSPFPIHGIERAMAIRPTILPWICLIGGLTGLVTGIILTHYTMGVTVPAVGALSGYAYLESGKPFCWRRSLQAWGCSCSMPSQRSTTLSSGAGASAA